MRKPQRAIAVVVMCAFLMASWSLWTTTQLQEEQAHRGERLAESVTQTCNDAFVIPEDAPLCQEARVIIREKVIQGEPGVPGLAGSQGATGPKGERGEKGDKGDPGFPGAPGLAGEPGEKGEQGDKGERGKDGQDGIQGPAGLSCPDDFTLQSRDVNHDNDEATPPETWRVCVKDQPEERDEAG